MNFSRISLGGLFLIALAFLTAACSLAAEEPVISENQISTSVRETTGALAEEREQATQNAAATETAVDTFTPVPTEVVLPSNTPSPTNTPEPATPEPTSTPTETPIPSDGRVAFPQGKTYVTINGELEEKSTDEYTIKIEAGQVFSVFVEPLGRTPSFSLVEEDGTELVTPDKKFTWYITNTQKTQDYTIQVITGNFATEYILHLSTLIDVQFDAGQTSKTIEGKLKAGDMIDYKALALRDQKAKITLTSTSGLARIYIYGLGAREIYVDYSDDASNWESFLPETQSHLIRVIAGNVDTSYKLTIEFTD